MENSKTNNIYSFEEFRKLFEELYDKTNSESLSYKTGDVAKILMENDQTIRNYCRDFKDFLDLKHKSKEHRFFSESDINKLLFVKYLLKEKNFSIKQAKEYLSTPQGKNLTKIEDFEDNNKMELLANLITEKLTPILEETVSRAMEENLDAPVRHITTSIEHSKDEIKNQIQLFADSTENNFKFLKEDMVNSKNFSIEWSEKIGDLIQESNKKIEQAEELALELETKKSGNFFSRLFKRGK
jgi:DNA-binding transcriptional MerR regulator